MKRALLRALAITGTAVVLLVLVLIQPKTGYAIPAFSRMYNTSCSTCHIDFPKLNDFGKAFKDAGFKFPSDDESMVKIPPVMLGAPAQAELWPKTVWPGKIPGQPPIGLRMNNYFQVSGKNANNFAYVPVPGSSPDVSASPGYVPRTDFETGYFSIFTAGNFGSDIAFWVDDDISVGGANANGGLGDGYLKFVNVSRFLHLPKDSLHIRVGQFELELPFSQARSWNISPWDIYTEANVGAMNSMFPQQNVNNAFALANVAQGIEFSGGHHYGGYYYALAIVNQNTSNVTNASVLVPSATGGNYGGVGFKSDSNFKDLYGRLMYRFNLERDKASRDAIQAAGAMGPRNHTYLQFGTFGYYGDSVQRMNGITTGTSAATVLTAREPFYRAGADFTFNYRNPIQIFGLWMYGHDQNLVPIDALGNPFPTQPVSFVNGVPATFSGGFVETDLMPYPWLVLIMRYDSVHSTADRINGLVGNLGAPFFGPISDTRNRITPGAQFLIHANIKASFEYQIRPQQQVLTGVDPVSGIPVVIPSFRSNTATAGLEFVY